jgi:hypothetical protein
LLILFHLSFGELALLLPHTDIDMVVFGASAYKLGQEAKASSLAARQYVYEFRAPEQCGLGSIRIQLYKESAIWEPIDVLSRKKMVPDVLIGLNTGISSFKTWWPVFTISRALSIPFAVTDYSRNFLAQDRLQYRTIVAATLANEQLDHHEVMGPEKLRVLTRSLDCPPSPSAMNPFMRPGHTGSGKTDRLPYVVNGFTCIVTPRPDAD